MRRVLGGIASLVLSATTLAAIASPAQAADPTLPLTISGAATCRAANGHWQVQWIIQARDADFEVVSIADPANGTAVSLDEVYPDQARASAGFSGQSSTAAVTVTVRFAGHTGTDTFSVSYPLGRQCADQSWPTCTDTPQYTTAFNAATGVTTVELTGPPPCLVTAPSWILESDYYQDVYDIYTGDGWTWVPLEADTPFAIAYVPSHPCRSRVQMFHDGQAFTLADKPSGLCLAPDVEAYSTCRGEVELRLTNLPSAGMPLIYHVYYYVMVNGLAQYTYYPVQSLAPGARARLTVPGARANGARIAITSTNASEIVWTDPTDCGPRRTGPATPPPVIPPRRR